MQKTSHSIILLLLFWLSFSGDAAESEPKGETLAAGMGFIIGDNDPSKLRWEDLVKEMNRPGFVRTGRMNTPWKGVARAGGLKLHPDPGINVMPWVEHCFRNSSFPYKKFTENPFELPWADAVWTSVEFKVTVGGMPPDPDYAYRDANGRILYDWGNFRLNLSPLAKTDYEITLGQYDNFCPVFVDASVQKYGCFGQIHPPTDYQHYDEYLQEMAKVLVEVFGTEKANRLRYRMGTEFNGKNRFIGNMEKYLELYDHTYRSFSSVIPGFRIGPWNEGGYHNESAKKGNGDDLWIWLVLKHYDKLIKEGRTKEVTPVDFLCISKFDFDYGKTSPTPGTRMYRTSACYWGEMLATFPDLLKNATCENHEFDMWGSPKPDSQCTAIFDSRQAVFYFNTIMAARQAIGNRYKMYRFDEVDTSLLGWLHYWYRPEMKDRHLPNPYTWVFNVLEKTVGMETFIIRLGLNTQTTEYYCVAAKGDKRDYLFLSAWDCDPKHTQPVTVNMKIPAEIFTIPDNAAFNYVELSPYNTPYHVMKKDLEKEGLLADDYKDSGPFCGNLANMTWDDGLKYIADHWEKYEKVLEESLTLKPFKGEIKDNTVVRAIQPGSIFVLTIDKATPSAPQKFTAEPICNNRIDLSWTDTAENEIAYVLERSVDNASFQEISKLGVDSSYFSDRQVSAGHSYAYRLKAAGYKGDSSYATIAKAQTKMLPTFPATIQILNLTSGKTEEIAKADTYKNPAVFATTSYLNNHDAIYPEIIRENTGRTTASLQAVAPDKKANPEKVHVLILESGSYAMPGDKMLEVNAVSLSALNGGQNAYSAIIKFPVKHKFANPVLIANAFNTAKHAPVSIAVRSYDAATGTVTLKINSAEKLSTIADTTVIALLAADEGETVLNDCRLVLKHGKHSIAGVTKEGNAPIVNMFDWNFRANFAIVGLREEGSQAVSEPVWPCLFGIMPVGRGFINAAVLNDNPYIRKVSPMQIDFMALD